MKKKKDEITIRSSAAEYLTYVASVGDQQDSIEMRYEDENIWLTQKMMATLYDVDVRTINEHIKKIYSDSELEEEATIRNFRIVRTEGRLCRICPVQSVPAWSGGNRECLHSGQYFAAPRRTIQWMSAHQVTPFGIITPGCIIP